MSQAVWTWGCFLKGGRFRQDQISGTFWREPNVLVDILDRTNVLQGRLQPLFGISNIFHFGSRVLRFRTAGWLLLSVFCAAPARVLTDSPSAGQPRIAVVLFLLLQFPPLLCLQAWNFLCISLRQISLPFHKYIIENSYHRLLFFFNHNV